jgi:hypothetical protein
VEVGKDQDGELITSCVIEPADVAPLAAASEARLTPNQQTMFSSLHARQEIAVSAWKSGMNKPGQPA